MHNLTATGARRAGLLTAAALLASTPAFAASTGSTLNVDATVTANCTVSTTALSFPAVNPISGANVDATGGLTVTCTNGTGWTASSGVGSGSGASYTGRRMTSGSNLLTYNIYTNSGRTTVWGDGTGSTATIGGTGSGVGQSVTLYGRVPLGQTSAAPGDYADTVAVTLTY